MKKEWGFEMLAGKDVGLGHLVRIHTSTVNGCAIRVQANGGRPCLLMLSEATVRPPYFFPFELADVRLVVSYGDNWTLEPILPEKPTIGHKAFDEVPGTLCLSPERVLIWADPLESVGVSAALFDVLSGLMFNPQPPHDAFMAVKRWRLWIPAVNNSGDVQRTMLVDFTAESR